MLEKIGSGAMGEVYRARDTTLGRDVAAKVLPLSFSKDPERLNRFRQEARLLARLNHAHIATIHGLEEHGDVRFLVMELVEGETLSAWIDRRDASLEEVLRLFLQIADALEEAHETGIVHRDLKPENIKVSPDGKVKLLDFGVAKALSIQPELDVEDSVSRTRTRETKAGTFLGTPAYMSPEQARGRSVDRRADVWAFGCLIRRDLKA